MEMDGYGGATAGHRMVTRWISALIGVAICCLSGRPADALTPTDTVSREVSVWNNPGASALGNWDAVSREMSVWNDPRASSQGITDAMSRETTVWNDPRYSALGISDAMTREVTVQAGPVIQQNALNALKGAGGLAKMSSGDMTTLNVVTNDTSANRVDIRDAVRLVRKAAGLDP